MVSPMQLSGRTERARAWLVRPDVTNAQLGSSLVVATLAVLTISPRGLHGRGLVVSLLLVLNCTFLLARHLPERLLPERLRLIGFGPAILAAAGILAVADGGMSSVFGYFVAGHAGYRLDRRSGLLVAGACSLACGGVLLLHLGWGFRHVPWYVGAAAGFALPVGLVSRARYETLAAAEAAAESARVAAASAERAAQAETRELISAERGRIAREVHDVLAHSLAGINLQLELADAMLEQGELGRARQATQQAQDIARRSLGEAQRTVRALRADSLPLVETLTALAESDPRVGRLEVAGDPVPVGPAAAQALVRTAQEALTNAHKHAPAAAVTMALDFAEGSVRLVVANGPGQPGPRPLAGQGSGLGLVGMRERAIELGGQLQAGPVEAGGWRVQLSLPVVVSR